MFKRLGALQKSNGGLNVSFLNTHPASDERVKVCAGHLGLFVYELCTAHFIHLVITKSNLKLYCQRHFLYEVLCVAGCQITWVTSGRPSRQGLARVEQYGTSRTSVG